MVLVVLFVCAAMIALYVPLGYLVHRARRRLGVPEGEIVAADDNRLGSPTLYSDRFDLVGRPDHLVRMGRDVIPVEQKPTVQRVRDSHVMQLATLCLLVAETYGRRPPYGILVLAGGVQQRVPFTLELERRLVNTASDMREILQSGVEPGPVWNPAKCRACGFRSHCWK